MDGVSNFFVQNCTCGRFHTVTFETVSLFFSYIYLRIPSYLGLRGEPFIFSDGFFRCSIQCFYTNSYVADFVLWVILEVTTLWPAHTATITSAILVPGWNPNLGYNFFSLILVRIHTNEFIQLLYKLYSTNSYTVWFLYQFIQFLYDLYSTNSYKVWFFYFVSKSPQAASEWQWPNKLFGDTKRILSLFYTNSYLEFI